MSKDKDKDEVSVEEAARLLSEIKRRPSVIGRREWTLDSEVLHDEKKLVKTNSGKYVIERVVIRSTTEYYTVREFDPELSYADSLLDFMDISDEGEKKDDTESDNN